jgi:hypothetical protein
MPPKFFTPEEANRLLPTIRPLLARLVAQRQEVRQHSQLLEEFRTRAGRDGGAMPGGKVSRALEEVGLLRAAIQGTAEQVLALGCQIKDLDVGLVDFPALRGREQVLLCWRLGEDRIRFWHGLQEGFAGRKPLDEDLPEA